MDRAQNYSLSFQVKNSVSCGNAVSGVTRCAPANTKISISAQRGTCRLERENYQCPSDRCGPDISSCTSRIVFSQVSLMKAPGEHATLLIDAPEFLVKQVSHYSTLPGQTNTIIISLSFNVVLSIPSKVSISGLEGTRIPDNPAAVSEILTKFPIFFSNSNTLLQASLFAYLSL